MSLREYMAINAVYSDIRPQLMAAAPRFEPMGWWECDLFAVLKSGRTTEYEVKLSRGDFFCDSKKGRPNYEPFRDGLCRLRECPEQRKHDLLAAGDVRGPNRFFYVTPKGLITLDELPVWAGLIELHDCSDEWRPATDWRAWRPSCVRKAPVLHKQKVRLKVLRDLHRRLHYRYLNSMLEEKVA